MLAAPSLCRKVATLQIRQYCSTAPILRATITRPRASPYHSTGGLLAKKRGGFFYPNAPPKAPFSEERKADTQQPTKRRSTRASSAPNSLRRVALEAQRSRDGKEKKKALTAGQDAKVCESLLSSLRGGAFVDRANRPLQLSVLLRNTTSHTSRVY